MASFELKSRSEKLYNKPDSNLDFLTSMDFHREEGTQINLKDINAKIQKIINRLKISDKDDISEWVLIQERKIQQLASKIKQQQQQKLWIEGDFKKNEKNKALKEQIRILVCSACACNISYDRKKTEKIIKDLYFSQYKKDILEVFYKAGYETHDYQQLYYEESSFLDLCCW